MSMFDSDHARAIAVIILLGSACLDIGRAAQPAGGPAESPMLGHPLSKAESHLADLTVAPDGSDLPTGQGSVSRGATLYGEQCAHCHGEAGAGGVGAIPRLTGGVGSLATDAPLQTVNSFWPKAPIIFDYIRRTMPPTAPQSLSNDDVYAITAYLLSVDEIVPKNSILNARRLARVKMPNAKGFLDSKEY